MADYSEQATIEPYLNIREAAALLAASRGMSRHQSMNIAEALAVQLGTKGAAKCFNLAVIVAALNGLGFNVTNKEANTMKSGSAMVLAND